MYLKQSVSDCKSRCAHICVCLTELELTVELLPVPANRVDANGEFSTGWLHASIDHGALSYILQQNSIIKLQHEKHREQKKYINQQK